MSNDIFLYTVPAFANPNDICLRILTEAAEVVVGDPGRAGRRRIPRKELDRRLKEQRDNTFSRRRFEELKEAELAAAQEADKAKNAAQREALRKAASAASEISPEYKIAPLDLEELTHALLSAASAKRASESIHQANIALALAHHLAMEAQANEEEDEEHVLMMLLS